MQFLTLTLALAAAISASPILRRDQYPSIAAVDQELNRVVLVPGTAADVSSKRRRDLAVPVVDATLNQILEHEGATAPALRARDQFPSIPVVDQELSRVVLVPGSASDIARRDLAVPVVDLEQNMIVEHEGAAAATNDRRDAAVGGIVPVVVDAGRIVPMPMSAENISS